MPGRLRRVKCRSRPPSAAYVRNSVFAASKTADSKFRSRFTVDDLTSFNLESRHFPIDSGLTLRTVSPTNDSSVFKKAMRVTFQSCFARPGEISFRYLSIASPRVFRTSNMRAVGHRRSQPQASLPTRRLPPSCRTWPTRVSPPWPPPPASSCRASYMLPFFPMRWRKFGVEHIANMRKVETSCGVYCGCQHPRRAVQ